MLPDESAVIPTTRATSPLSVVWLFCRLGIDAIINPARETAIPTHCITVGRLFKKTAESIINISGLVAVTKLIKPADTVWIAIK